MCDCVRWLILKQLSGLAVMRGNLVRASAKDRLTTTGRSFCSSGAHDVVAGAVAVAAGADDDDDAIAGADGNF